MKRKRKKKCRNGSVDAAGWLIYFSDHPEQMKKHLMLALLAAAFSFQASAQVKLGIKAGLNLADIKPVYSGNSNSSLDYKMLASANGGALLQVHLGKRLALQAEALLSGKGGTVEDANGNTSGPRLLYFSVPVLAVFKPVEVLGLEAGVEFGSAVQARVRQGGKSIDVSKSYSGRDLGLVAGAQAQLTSRLNLDVRYVYGLKEIHKSTIGSTSVKLYNRLVQVSLGYLILR